MKQSSIKIIATAAEVLNQHVTRKTPSGEVLAGNDRNVVLGIVNEILSAAAEGGRLVAAIESNGELLGFVPRMNVPLPEMNISTLVNTPAGPDEPYESR
jgi:hypothetical protein